MFISIVLDRYLKQCGLTVIPLLLGLLFAAPAEATWGKSGPVRNTQWTRDWKKTSIDGGSQDRNRRTHMEQNWGDDDDDDDGGNRRQRNREDDDDDDGGSRRDWTTQDDDDDDDGGGRFSNKKIADWFGGQDDPKQGIFKHFKDKSKGKGGGWHGKHGGHHKYGGRKGHETPVPEPSTYLLLGTSLIICRWVIERRRLRQAKLS